MLDRFRHRDVCRGNISATLQRKEGGEGIFRKGREDKTKKEREVKGKKRRRRMRGRRKKKKGSLLSSVPVEPST